MLKFLNLVFFFVISITGFAQKNLSKIAFGSCGSEEHPLPVFDLVVKHKPGLFIFLGDNIYGDTKNMDTLQHKYNMLAGKRSYQH